MSFKKSKEAKPAREAREVRERNSGKTSSHSRQFKKFDKPKKFGQKFSERFERSDRSDRSERSERSERVERDDKDNRKDKKNINNKGDKVWNPLYNKPSRHEKHEKSESKERTDKKFGSKKRFTRDEFPERAHQSKRWETRETPRYFDENKKRTAKKFGSDDQFAEHQFSHRKEKPKRWEERENPRRGKSDRNERNERGERNERKFQPKSRQPLEKVFTAAPSKESVESSEKTMLFSQFKFSEILQESLSRLQFTTATPIQAKSIPVALKGRDILGSAQTGTGKTLAFALPILEKMFISGQGCALILAPTRELAAQILKAFHDLLPRKSSIKTALLIGGEPMGKQFRDLRLHPRIVVGTPGRVIDHLSRNSLNLDDSEFLVLDEADRMMDMGFEPQIQEIMQCLPEVRQTFMFSATFSPYVLKLAHKYLHEPERITIGEQHHVSHNIRQEVLQVKPAFKFEKLIQELDKREGTVIIFVKTKRGADELADKLSDADHYAKAIHGDLQQRKRDQVIKGFRQQNHRILVATDVAARGLDIPHIEHVINYDLPQTPEDYMHRIGRTARAGKKGSALSLVVPAEMKKWNGIERFIQKKQAKR